MQIFPALAQQPAEFATVTLEPESTAKPRPVVGRGVKLTDFQTAVVELRTVLDLIVRARRYIETVTSKRPG